jgi:hypothetical protein
VVIVGCLGTGCSTASRRSEFGPPVRVPLHRCVLYGANPVAGGIAAADSGVVVLVEGHDEQVVVGAGLVEVVGEVVACPGVAGGQGAVVHVGHRLGTTTATVGRATRFCGEVGEVDRGLVVARVASVWRGAAGEADTG